MSLLTEVLAQPDKLTRLTPSEWDRLLRLARYSKLLGALELLSSRQQLTSSIPSVAQDIFESERLRCAMIYCQIHRELFHLEQVLGQSQTPLVLLKGTAYLLDGLPCALGRRFNDIDVLVPKRDLSLIETRLRQSGWQSDPQLNNYDQHYYRDWMHEIPALKHPERGIEVDIHHNITPPVGRMPVAAAELFEAIQPIEGTRFYRLSDEDLFLHSATHLLFNDELRGGLRDLWDLREISDHFVARHGEAYWFRLEQRARVLGLLPPLDLALRNLHQLLAAPIPAALLSGAETRCKGRLGDQLLMRLIQLALTPDDPDRLPPKWSQELLFIRSHWVRMPPLMLVSHLGRKTWHRWTQKSD